MLKKLVLGPAAALVLLYVSAAPALASSEVGHGSLFLNGGVVGTVVPPAQLPAGTGQDPFYKVTNGASGQLGIAGVGPGDAGAFHGGAWQVWTVTFHAGVGRRYHSHAGAGGRLPMPHHPAELKAYAR